MRPRSLADVVGEADSLVDTLRGRDIQEGSVHWDVYPEEYTNWMDEQRAWRESCILMDQSYHLANYYVEGPDALRVNSELGVNDFTDLDSFPQAKQHPVCNPDGYIIGDPVLFYLSEDRVSVVGNKGIAQKWIRYNVETGDYDAAVTDVYSPYGETPPIDFRFEVQGPNATAVLGDVVDGPMPDVSFFEMDEISIGGVDLYVLAHGMASATGYEIFGPYEHHDDVKEAILDAGEAYDLRQLGSKAYKTATLTTGWLPTGLPAVYDHEEMADYREWLDADSVEANWTLGGSFESDDVTDYYIDPVELGYEHIVKLDHEFVGREAIETRLENPQREKVTLVWDAEDVVDVYASLFDEGDTYKFVDLPDIAQRWDMGHYDRVEVGGDVVGKAVFSGYDANQREMLSLSLLETAYCDPGTEVTLVWGEEDSPKATVEPHVEKEIRATVAPSPYVREREKM